MRWLGVINLTWENLQIAVSLSLSLSLSHRKYLTHNIGSASALPIINEMKCFRASYNTVPSESERERRKWRHHCRAKTGDEFTLSLAQNSHLAMILHFPLPKIRTFRFSLHTSRLTLLKWSPLWRWNSQWVFTLRHSAKKFRLLSSDSLKWRDWTIFFWQKKLFFLSKKWIKLIPKTIGNRKRDCAWGCARGINTTRDNPQIASTKSGRRSYRSPDWFVLFDLQIFSGGVNPPSATSRAISFSISNSFWW